MSGHTPNSQTPSSSRDPFLESETNLFQPEQDTNNEVIVPEGLLDKTDEKPKCPANDLLPDLSKKKDLFLEGKGRRNKLLSTQYVDLNPISDRSSHTEALEDKAKDILIFETQIQRELIPLGFDGPGNLLTDNPKEALKTVNVLRMLILKYKKEKEETSELIGRAKELEMREKDTRRELKSLKEKLETLREEMKALESDKMKIQKKLNESTEAWSLLKKEQNKNSDMKDRLKKDSKMHQDEIEKLKGLGNEKREGRFDKSMQKGREINDSSVSKEPKKEAYQAKEIKTPVKNKKEEAPNCQTLEIDRLWKVNEEITGLIANFVISKKEQLTHSLTTYDDYCNRKYN